MDKRDHKRCFISGCYGSNDKENKRVGFFGVPKASLAIWQDIIPKDGLSASSKICSKHFDEADIEKGRTIQDIFYPYSRWQLKAGAVPKLLLGLLSSQHPLAIRIVSENMIEDILLHTLNLLRHVCFYIFLLKRSIN